MASFTKISYILLLVHFIFFIAQCNAFSFLKSKIYVKIINQLDGNLPLTVHCKSKDDDLGNHVLPFNGTTAFHFRPNFFDTTQFWCRFDWQDQSKIFDVYKAGRDMSKKFTNFNWGIKASGPCMQDLVSEHFDKCFKWNKNK